MVSVRASNKRAHEGIAENLPVGRVGATGDIIYLIELVK